MFVSSRRCPPPRCLVLATLLAGSVLIGCAPKATPQRRVLDGAPETTAPTVTVDLPLTVGAPADWQFRRRLVDGPGVLVHPVEKWRTPMGGPVTLPLSVGDSGVWVVASGVVHLLGMDGSVLLRSALKASTTVTEAAQGPVVGADDGALLAFSPSTGKVGLVWPGSGRARAGAVPLGSAMIWVTSDGAVNSTLGEPLGRLLTVTGSTSSDAERVYVQTQSGAVAALSADGPVWKASVPGPGVGAAVVGEDIIHAAWDSFQGDPGGVITVNAIDGVPRWSLPLPSPPSAGLALTSDTLLVPCADGTLQALDPKTGAERWAERLGPNALSTAPLVAGRSAWIGDEGGKLYRVDLDDGGVAWSLDLGAPITSGPELAWGMMLVGLSTGDVVAIGSGA